MTLYQAGEQIYKEFDKLCLIDSGRQIYYGKASEVRPYFEGLGFEFLPGSTTSDVLSFITNPLERRIKRDFKGKVPTTVEELETAFRQSEQWGELQLELVEYDQESSGYREKFSQAVKEDKAKLTRKRSPYTVGFQQQIWYLMKREAQLQWQDQRSLWSRL